MVVEGRARAGAGPDVVHYGCIAVVRLADDVVAEAVVELLGGRDRHSVGGQIAEGPRWWRGRVTWQDGPVAVQPGVEVRLELDNGRSAVAVVEPRPEATSGEAVIRGLGPPPFEVDLR